MAIPTFAVLWRNYPQGKIAGACAQHTHQCAIKMSAALAKSCFTLKGYKDATCKANGVVHARGAESLANYLSWKMFKPLKQPFYCARSAVKGKTGIIFFQNITGFRGGEGDHIDLWNGSETKSGQYFKSCSWVWFWALK